MSRVTRHKHVLREMKDDDYELPKERQRIVRIVCSRGNNLHEVETTNADEHFLVTMPTKFRKNVWVKRGDYILVEPIEEGDKVKAEICKILTSEHIKEYRKANIWPERFANNKIVKNDVQNGKHVDSGSEIDSLQPNMNRLMSKRDIDSNDDVGDDDEFSD